MQPQRHRIELARVERPCGLCGSDDVVVIESRAVRRGLARLNPAFTRDIRLYELCRRCGAKQLLAGDQSA